MKQVTLDGGQPAGGAAMVANAGTAPATNMAMATSPAVFNQEPLAGLGEKAGDAVLQMCGSVSGRELHMFCGGGPAC